MPPSASLARTPLSLPLDYHWLQYISLLAVGKHQTSPPVNVINYVIVIHVSSQRMWRHSAVTADVTAACAEWRTASSSSLSATGDTGKYELPCRVAFSNYDVDRLMERHMVHATAEAWMIKRRKAQYRRRRQLGQTLTYFVIVCMGVRHIVLSPSN